MKNRVALLISPGSIDGYPPVRYQAILLADAGFRVCIVTTGIEGHEIVTRFDSRLIEIHSVPSRGGGKIPATLRSIDYIKIISKLRFRFRNNPIVEIAFDPFGVLYSDFAFFRPRFRIAHFHETLQEIGFSFLEKRLLESAKKYSRIVVADAERALLIAEQLTPAEKPLVVPNYPLRLSGPEEASKNSGFEVVYCGSLGTSQMLTEIISSVPLWPMNASLSLIGNDNTPLAQEMKIQVRELNLLDRVNFGGWVNLSEVPQRLRKAHLGIAFLDNKQIQWSTALGASNKRYQYMEAGLPQVGDMNPGVKELLEGQGIGICVRDYSAREIAAAIERYVSNPERLAKEGRQASNLHQQKYHYEAAFSPELKFIEETMSQIAEH